MYEERPSRLGGAVLWTRRVGPAENAPVLPDGCMDLLWLGDRLVVAGPDTRAYRPVISSDRDAPQDQLLVAGVRFAPGAAPALLGVPAHALRDQRVDLAELWSASRVRELEDRVRQARDRAAALESLAVECAAATESADPALRGIVASLDAGGSVAATADAVGLGTRALHRRSLAAFGYGPKKLARILRLQRALARARAGHGFAVAAAESGYADQAHLARDVRELTGMPLGELLKS
ncbi:helix-turn-helix domain-containing protein [Streptomyces sp. NA04227]|uniref:helix-turn-helix domain-containing protein n=1 Tax=Streptomyces sp. NA04227 TaxID=2742136 RepID=UPI001592A9D2|nr:helix-turn-helix domain-containing protein [Streptomyces sp. NA04227]QKW09980.1 helix-turn-helix domain-containing protein [Streptomyces sp. NA04227]